MGEGRVRWRILAALAELEGDTQLRQEARAILESIIEQIPEGELRASFLALPAVKRLQRP